MIVANDILTWIEQRILCETVVSIEVPTAIPAGLNEIIVADPSLYSGALVIVGGATPEIIQVIGYAPEALVAFFNQPHAAGDPIYGATFPRGQVPRGQDHDPLFYQSEMLAYLGEVTNDFMLKTWPVYNIAQPTVTTGIRYYNTPSDAIRIERMSRINSTQPLATQRMYDLSISDLDMMNPDWAGDRAVPKSYFEDQQNTGQYGVYPVPSNNYLTWLWYSQRALVPSSWTLLTPMPIPDPLCYIVYYGVLARIFGKDGEMRDPGREEYCRNRYLGGIEIVVRLLEGIQAWALPGPISPQRTPARN